MDPNEEEVRRLRCLRYRLLWLGHAKRRFQGPPRALVELELLRLALHVLKLEEALQDRPDWHLIACHVEAEEWHDRALLAAEVCRPR